MSEYNELAVPDDDWMSHAFVSKLATQVSLPYKKPKTGTTQIVRRNGSLEVSFTVTKSNGVLPYGKYPRLIEMWATTMIKTRDSCFDPKTNILSLGTTFREFLRLVNIEVGGWQLKSIKSQLENLFSCTYTIVNEDDTQSHGVSFGVAEEWHIDWLRSEPQEHGLFVNWVRLSQGYVDKLRDNPVPVNLAIAAQISSPMALDIYWWLTRRYSYLHKRQSITWQQLYTQFGSSNVLRSFKQSFKRAVKEVQAVYPEARITCGRDYVTIYPSATSVPTTAQTRHTERLAAKTSGHDDGHWFEVMGEDGRGQVYGSLDIYSLADARAHLSGEVPPEQCPVCQYDDRNRSHHGG